MIFICSNYQLRTVTDREGMYVRAACTSIWLLVPRACSWSRSDLCQVCSKTQANLDSTPPREYERTLSNCYSSLDMWKNVFLFTIRAFSCTTVQHDMWLSSNICSGKTTAGLQDYSKVTWLSLCYWTCPKYFVVKIGIPNSNLNTWCQNSR